MDWERMLRNKRIEAEAEYKVRQQADKAKEQAEENRILQEGQRCMAVLDSMGTRQKLQEIRDQIWKAGEVVSELSWHRYEWDPDRKRLFRHSEENPYGSFDEVERGRASIRLTTTWPKFVPYKPGRWESGGLDGEGSEWFPAEPAHTIEESMHIEVSANLTNSGIVIQLNSITNFNDFMYDNRKPFLHSDVNDSNNKITDMLLAQIHWGGRPPKKR